MNCPVFGYIIVFFLGMPLITAVLDIDTVPLSKFFGIFNILNIFKIFDDFFEFEEKIQV